MDMRGLVNEVFPADRERANLLGRVYDPEDQGPSVVSLRRDVVSDISHIEPTMSALLEREDAAEIARSAPPRKTWNLEEVLASTFLQQYDRPHFLAPVDLQVVKAAGVTFIDSMLERIIEEQASGDPRRASEIRTKLNDVIGGALRNVRPGSSESEKVKSLLVSENIWSQYLEVGIGPDPEIFSKAPLLSAVGVGACVGVLARSNWNNSEPELAIVVNSRGNPVGATLGNDMNLRDFEGRSALLLTKAKDNNASCALGPAIRLFDDAFTFEDAGELEIRLEVSGEDGFEMQDLCSMTTISRNLIDLINHTIGAHHQYPDGFVLLAGTPFAPTKDRGEIGAGFTHHEGDTVRISTPTLGALTNRITSSEDAPRWTYGLMALMRNLSERDLLSPAARPT